MKKYINIFLLSAFLCVAPAATFEAKAQIAVLEVIKAGVKKVITALDLQIQRLQNKTIWLQNAQKVLENQLSKLKLTEIADWTSKQKELYGKYYQELQKVKSAISYYQRIKAITQKQISLVNQYRQAYDLFRQDSHFTPDEINYMGKVYSGILDASIKNLDQIILVTSSFKTQMSDAKRLELINSAADRLDENYNDLRQFNNQNIGLSLQRSKDQRDIQSTLKLYGIQSEN